MNRFLLCFALLLLLSAPLAADPEIPASAWKQSPQGVAVAVTTTTGTDKGTRTCTINAFLKNTSSTNVWFGGYEGSHRYFEIFYTGAGGSEVPLRNYTRDELQANMELNYPVIRPRNTLSLNVDLSPAEIILVRGREMKCVFELINLSKGITVESSPKVLVEDP